MPCTEVVSVWSRNIIDDIWTFLKLKSFENTPESCWKFTCNFLTAGEPNVLLAITELKSLIPGLRNIL